MQSCIYPNSSRLVNPGNDYQQYAMALFQPSALLSGRSSF
jgi:hypothetical protein